MLAVDTTPVIATTATTGTINWGFNSIGETFDYLGDGEVLTLTFTVRATDDDATPLSDDQTVTVNVTGTNDGPAVQVVDGTGTITEGATLTDSGSVTFTDVDLTDRPTATEATTSVSAVQQDGSTPLTLTGAQQSAVEAAFSITNVGGNTHDGTVTWDFTIAESDIDFLANGDVATAIFTITQSSSLPTGSRSSTAAQNLHLSAYLLD